LASGVKAFKSFDYINTINKCGQLYKLSSFLNHFPPPSTASNENESGYFSNFTKKAHKHRYPDNNLIFLSVYAPAFSPCCSSPSSSISQTTLLLFPLFPTPVEIHEQRANIILYNYFFLYSKIKNKKSQFLFLSSWHPMTPSSQILLYFHTHSLSLFLSLPISLFGH
jgi:hypothetical protein